MSLQALRQKVVRLGAALLCATVIALAMPGTASAWHGGHGWGHGHFHGYYHHGGWGWGHWYGGPAFFPPPLPAFSVGVYPGYYPAPYPYYPYQPAPPVYAPAPSVSFGFAFGR